MDFLKYITALNLSIDDFKDHYFCFKSKQESIVYKDIANSDNNDNYSIFFKCKNCNIELNFESYNLKFNNYKNYPYIVKHDHYSMMGMGGELPSCAEHIIQNLIE